MMRLSEAIRLGSMIRPQIGGRYFGEGKSCALGAALEANGVVYEDDGQGRDYNNDVLQTWPWVEENEGRCPYCTCRGTTDEIVMHMNDEHFLTREEIANWVEEQERAHEAEAPAGQEPVGLQTLRADVDQHQADAAPVGA